MLLVSRPTTSFRAYSVFNLSRTWEKIQAAIQSSLPPGQAMTRDVTQKLREEFGLGRLMVALTGAAPIHRQVLEYFHSINLPLCELFGMSELTGPGTFNLIGRNKVGSVGLPMQGSKVKIDCPNEKGEGEVSSECSLTHVHTHATCSKHNTHTHNTKNMIHTDTVTTYSHNNNAHNHKTNTHTHTDRRTIHYTNNTHTRT